MPKLRSLTSSITKHLQPMKFNAHVARRPAALVGLFCFASASTAIAQDAVIVQDTAIIQDTAIVQKIDPLADYRDAAIEKWGDEIAKLEQRDQDEPDPADGILLIGSSSIRRWSDADRDLAPYRTINRGYGGSTFADVAVFAERLITPHDFRGVVIFVGNDISGQDTDRTPAEVEPLVRHVASVVRKHRPDAPLLIVEVTPTPKRFEVWPAIRGLNAMLREVCLSEPNVHFVATAESFLTFDNRPRGELFVDDRLHLNEAGYTIWADLIRERLTDVLRRQASR